MNAFCSESYWESRYRAGGTSGAGSYGRLAAFKAAFINDFIERHAIERVLDLGCGDGNLLSLLRVSAYTGVDVSPTSLARCAERFPMHRFLPPEAVSHEPPADLALSVDVVFHLVEDAVFSTYMTMLFAHAARHVLIYSSNVDHAWPAPHVRHRRFTDHVAATQPAWRLAAHVPNPYPFRPAQPEETSFADFFVYTTSGGASAQT